jgi:hypothetical protein
MFNEGLGDSSGMDQAMRFKGLESIYPDAVADFWVCGS